MSDDNRMSIVNAHRETLTTPEAVDAFALDLDDRVRALYFTLKDCSPEARGEVAHALDKLRSAIGNAVRVCGLRGVQ